MILYPYIFALDIGKAFLSLDITHLKKCLYLVHLAARLVLGASILWPFAFHCACSSVPSHPGWRLVEPRCIVSFPVKPVFLVGICPLKESFMHKVWNFLGNEAVKLKRYQHPIHLAAKVQHGFRHAVDTTKRSCRLPPANLLFKECWRREILPFWENGIWIFCL